MESTTTDNTSADTGPLLRINFRYTVPTQEFAAAVSPLAQDFADVDGLRWKIWALNEEESRFSGLLFFADTESLQAFLQSDLAQTVTGHPVLSDFEVTVLEVMGAETMVTRGPVGASATDTP